MQALTSTRNHNKENQASEPIKELQKLKVELNDRTFQLRKLEEDHAQEKAKIYIQLQKEKQIHAKTIKELKDKIKEDNEGWVRMIDDMRKKSDEALAMQKMQIQGSCRNETSHTLKDMQERHIQQVADLKRCIDQRDKLHQKSEEQWAKDKADAIQKMTHYYKRLEHEKQKSHLASLSSLKQQYEEDITKLRSIYLKEEHLKQHAELELQNSIKSHVREKIAWEHTQNDLNMQIELLQQKIVGLQAQILELNVTIKSTQEHFQHKIEQIITLNSNKMKQIQSQHCQKQKQNSCVYTTQIQNLRTEFDKLLDIHKRKEQSWHESGRMVLQLYEKRESKKEDVKAIQKLEVELIKKDFLIERERKELKNCKLQLENMEEIYDRIFIYNSSLNRSKAKSYQIKKLKASCQLNQSNRSTIISDKNLDKRYGQDKNE